jgi:hypothetical protein
MKKDVFHIKILLLCNLSFSQIKITILLFTTFLLIIIFKVEEYALIIWHIKVLAHI